MFDPLFSSSFYPFMNRLNTVGFSDLLASYSIYVSPTVCLCTFIPFVSNICLFFYASALVSIAYAIIGSTFALYIFYFISFLIIFVSPDKIFKQPATLAAFWAWTLLYNTISVFSYWTSDFHNPRI
jgi:hypothetical protein